MSNPQEPNGREDMPRNPNQPGQYPPPPVPPAPGNAPQAGDPHQAGQPQHPGQPAAPPQWQQPPSYAGSQAGNPPYGGPQNTNPGAQNPYPQGQYAPGQYPPNQYPPNQYPYGQQPTQPAKKRKVLWIVLGIVAGVIVLAVVGVLVLVNLVGNATSKARSLADEFTNLVVAGDTERAYDDYLQQELKDQLDKESFVDGIAGLELDSSCKPNYSSVNVNNTNGRNTADISGTLQCDGKSIDLRYVFEGTNDLKMSSIRLRP
ncbi:hypothetical protein [Paenarthrobacter sp. NPDC018779]|uniref:hypothetical protein n=1 Tax=Paenarthrobacter sp. NPDC018779 TaxID=3364375 RepID=UPI0037C6C0E5